jgi:hypothetical protein
MHGALNCADAPRQVLFGFRVGTPEDNRISDLKRRILAKRYNAFHYRDLSELRAIVTDQLWETICADHPTTPPPDPASQERARQIAFSETQRRVYVRSRSIIDDLSHCVATAETPVAVVGPRGMGKTSMLANWANLYRREDLIIVTYFAQAERDGVALPKMLSSVIREISTATTAQSFTCLLINPNWSWPLETFSIQYRRTARL